ncbi:MAG: TlpA family protein disulfide reductase [Candidatus Omnitrophica bacterium]|nr:TlpA family protein disulfide reductase [Candidatus Omnitrophota bacterium]
MNKIRVIMFVSLMFFFAGIKIVSAQFSPFEAPTMAGEKAKDFSLPTYKGSTLNFNESFRKGKKTVVFFWTTWCPHCQDALKNLQGRLGELEKNNIQLVLVDLGEKGDMVKEYLTKVHLNADSALDQDNKVADAYEVVGIPTFVFIDENGVVKEAGHELPDNLDEIFKK